MIRIIESLMICITGIVFVLIFRSAITDEPILKSRLSKNSIEDWLKDNTDVSVRFDRSPFSHDAETPVYMVEMASLDGNSNYKMGMDISGSGDTYMLLDHMKAKLYSHSQ